MATILLQIGVIYFLGHLFNHLFMKYRIPDVLLFMLLGVVIGPILLLVTPQDFGGSGHVLSALALLVILFQSGTTLNMKSLAEVSGVGTLLTLLTFVISGALVFLASLPFTQSWQLSVLTGLILAGTSSAVVIPMTQALGVSDKIKNILLLESSLTDVLCIVLTLAVSRAFIGDGLDVTSVSSQVFLSFAVALVIGAAAGLAWAYIKQSMPAQFATIAFAILIYSVVELLGFSGPISVMCMGFTLANAHRFKKVPCEATLTDVESGFYSELVFVLKTFFFIYLGISMRFDNWVVLPVSILFMLVLFAVRLILVKGLLRGHPSRVEIFYTTLLIPKGLAAAVLAGVPAQSGVVGAEIIPEIVFPTVLVSIVLTSLLIPVASRQ